MQPSSTVSSKLTLILFQLFFVSLFVSKMTIKGGTSQACAACKYQRRRCTPECPLRPFFPADEPKMFQNAHRLFGVCNIMKILKKLNHQQREEAMKSIIYESDIKERFPVHGCWGIICQLHHELQQVADELQYVNARIAYCKERVQENINSKLDLGMMMMMPTSESIPFFDDHYQLDIVSNNGGAANYLENVDDMVKPMLAAQNPYCSIGNHFQMASSELAYPIQQEIEVDQDYEDIPFENLHIHSEDACESTSAESSFKGTTQFMEQVYKNEFKTEDACSSLTSVN